MSHTNNSSDAEKYCDMCDCYCGCHPCNHTLPKPDLVDFLIEAGIDGYKAIEYAQKNMSHTNNKEVEDWKEEFWYKVAEWNNAQPEDIDIYANQLEMLIEYHMKERVHQELQKALRCGRDMGDGSICGCKLDCHLHDWRQRDGLQKARHDWLREEIKAIKNRKYQNPKGQRAFTKNEAFNEIIDRYQSELDQLK